jgi:hypothetical protein
LIGFEEFADHFAAGHLQEILQAGVQLNKLEANPSFEDAAMNLRRR